MADRLTIDEFFAALKTQNKKPYIDIPESRKAVEYKVKSLTKYYPIKDRWPVLDLESAYENYLNNRPDLIQLVSDYDYTGVINLDGYDEMYSIDEWFGDFLIQYKLNDTVYIRHQMLKKLPQGCTWNASDLYEAYYESTKFSIVNVFKKIF